METFVNSQKKETEIINLQEKNGLIENSKHTQKHKQSWTARAILTNFFDGACGIEKVVTWNDDTLAAHRIV